MPPQNLWQIFGDNTRFLGVLLLAVAGLLFYGYAGEMTPEDITSFQEKHPELTNEQAASRLAESKEACWNWAIGVGTAGLVIFLVGHAICHGFARRRALAILLTTPAVLLACFKGYHTWEALLASDFSDAFCQGMFAYGLGYYAWDGVRLCLFNGTGQQRETAAPDTISDAAVG